MEPISIAMTFATIVSLMADFVSHLGTDESKNFDSFMSWLAEQRHDEVRQLLQSNQSTIVSIKALLGESRQEILSRLNALDKKLATVASGVSEYSGIAHVAHPTSALSEQAISVLEQFYDANASAILEIKMHGGIMLAFTDGDGGRVRYTEPRFIEDDLTTLLGLGLLDLDYNRKGDRVFKFKRTAASLIVQRRGAK